MRTQPSASSNPSRPPTHGPLTSIRTVLVGIPVVYVVVVTAKLGYGLLSGSVGMSAEGLNCPMDGMSNVVELIGVSVAARPPDENHPYNGENEGARPRRSAA